MSEPHEVLAKWRKGLGLTRAQAREMVSPPVSAGSWYAWEKGIKPPGLHNAFEIQRITGGLIVASSWARVSKKAPKAAPIAKAS